MAAKSKKKDNSKKAGLIAFGATLLIYALIFPFNKLGHFIIGGGLAALAGWIVKIMATPLKCLDRNAKSKAALDVTIIEDDYARGVVEKGVEMLDALKAERDAINESVFSRRINDLRENLDKVLRNIIEEPDEARHLRKMNSYYLPTTLKLLQGYRSAKAQGASYMAIAETREDVLGMLDKLNEALAELLVTMLQNDLEAMDVEIEVFDRMLKSDGLRPDEVTQQLRKIAQAAAREFPVSASPTVKSAAAAQLPTNAAAQGQSPVLNVPQATASARQLQQGAPVLHVPQAPAAPDFSDAASQHTKA